MCCRTYEDVSEAGGGKALRNIYKEFDYNNFYCEAVCEITNVEVIVQEITDTVGSPIFHSVKCTWTSVNECSKSKKCCAYQSVLEKEY